VNRGKKVILILSSFLCTLLFSPFLWASQKEGKAGVQVEVFAARPATRMVAFTGYTRARHIMGIVSEEAGRCTSVLADVGDTIGREGIFAILDRTFIAIAIEKNRVDQERLENMKAYYAKEVRRYEQLVVRETAAESTLDGFRNKLDQSEFQLQSLKVEAANLKERRSRHLIRIPPGWTVIERTVEPGQWISVGTHLGRAGDFRTLLVPFSLSPQEFSVLKQLGGMPELRFPDEGNGGLTLKAVVERVSPAFDPETRKISVDLAVRKGLSEMRGGLRAELTLSLPDPSGAVMVPSSAVTERYEEFWLTRLDGEQVRVMLIDHGPQNTSRIRSPMVKPGDKFRLRPEQ
jgi:RND family efflux transporter MFP subunit